LGCSVSEYPYRVTWETELDAESPEQAWAVAADILRGCVKDESFTLEVGPPDSTLEERITALEEMERMLCKIALELPARFADADSKGVREFSCMVWGYKLVYYKTETSGNLWQAYVSDTASAPSATVG